MASLLAEVLPPLTSVSVTKDPAAPPPASMTALEVVAVRKEQRILHIRFVRHPEYFLLLAQPLRLLPSRRPGPCPGFLFCSHGIVGTFGVSRRDIDQVRDANRVGGYQAGKN